MALPIFYGRCTETSYLDAGETLAVEVAKGNYCGVSKKINATFFAGGPLSPKSCKHIMDCSRPDVDLVRIIDKDQNYLHINAKTRISGLCPVLETIPFLGSAFAAINVIGFFFSMLSAQKNLNKAVRSAAPRTTDNVRVGDCRFSTDKIFKAAISYTVNQNRLYGSLLALVPFLKPIIRTVQGILYGKNKT